MVDLQEKISKDNGKLEETLSSIKLLENQTKKLDVQILKNEKVKYIGGKTAGRNINKNDIMTKNAQSDIQVIQIKIEN